MKRNHEYDMPAIYSQIILLKPELTHVTPVRDQDLQLMDWNVVRFTKLCSKVSQILTK